MKTNEQGFTLIEVMISLAVVALALCGVLFASTTTQHKIDMDFERAIAIQDAARVIEQIRNSAATGIFPNNVVTAFPNNGAVAGFNNLTNQTVRVTYVNTAANPLDTTVSVTWTLRGRYANQTESIRTFITNRT